MPTYNATGWDGYTAVSTMSDVAVGPIFYLTLTLGLIIFILVLLSNEHVMKWLLNIKKKLRYTVIGLITTGIGGILYKISKIAGKQAADGNPIILKVIGFVIGSFIFVTLLGWFIDKVFINRIVKSYKNVKQDKLYKKRKAK